MKENPNKPNKKETPFAENTAETPQAETPQTETPQTENTAETPQTETPQAENTAHPGESRGDGALSDDAEFYERQYFSGDSLKETEDEDDEEENPLFDALSRRGAEKSSRQKKASGKKKRLLALVSVVLLAAALFGVYEFVLKNKNGPGEDLSNIYKLSKNCYDIIGRVETDAVILFKESENTLSADPYGKYIYAYAETFAYEFPRVTVLYGEGEAYCAVKSGEKIITYTEEDFFNTLENGSRFSFNGEVLFGTAILEVTGATHLGDAGSFSLWALPGYDLDGDTLSNSGRPFMYPNITRADVQSIVVTNKHGTYKAYRMENEGAYSSEFYFEGAEFCQYNQELFASLVVNSTYVLTYGKAPDVKDLKDYGLGSEDDAQATIEVFTLDGKYHKILIGDEIPSSGGYYAKYYNKDFVYIVDASYGSDVLQPLTSILNADLGHIIASPNDTYEINEVYIKYPQTGVDVFVARKQDLALSSNITVFDSSQSPGELLNDKVRQNSGYTDWTALPKVFTGLKSSDGKDMTIQLQLTNYAHKEGKYAVEFGLARDSATSAALPSAVKVYAYVPPAETDDDDAPSGTYIEVAGAAAFDQSDKSYKRYTLYFDYEPQLKAIKIVISAPAQGYVVLDEITAYADGKDAIPNESVTGIWKILSPENYIQPGTNYAVPDPSSFANTLYGISTLVGDKVMEYKVFDGDEEAHNALMAKYFLDEPERIIYYSYKNFKSYIYVSPPQKGETEGEKWYYAYANVSYTDETGQIYNVSPNIIARVEHATAPYLSWTPSDLIDRAAFTMYIDKIDTIEMAFGGASHRFTLRDTDDNGKMDTVYYGDGVVDTANFRIVYVSVLECTRAGIYVPAEGEITEDKLIFRFTMHSELKDTEIKFYRVSSTKVLYQINGEYSEFYVRYSDVSTIMQNVTKLIEGKKIAR